MGTARKAPIPFPLPEDLTGAQVGRFVIRSKLGAGGMGEVYYAEDTKLRRPVALKRVARRLGRDPEARQRILREAQRASALCSEYIAGIHDVIDENGELFVVMEYVEGQTLRQRLQRPITLDQFFQIATQCTEALARAHEEAIVHCDIKPENIILTPQGHVKILDFGVAKHLPRSDQSSTLDNSGAVAGTPAYMAPEVLLEKPPDGRSDLFSLGVVFYELLTRQQPFLANSFVITGERILHETPAAIRLFNPALPQGLETIVMKAMAKAPEQRYANARELLKDLRLVQAGAMPSKLEPATPVQEKPREMRWLLAAVVVLAVAANFVVTYGRRRTEPILAERGWVLISDFEIFGDAPIPDIGVREGMSIALQQSRYVNVFPRTRVHEVLQRMKRAEVTRIDEAVGREICQRENLQVLLSGTIERMGQRFQITIRALEPRQGNLLFAEQERFDREGQFFEKADQLAKRIRKDLGESLEHIEKSSRPLARVTTASLPALQLYSQAQDARDQGRDEQVQVLLRGALTLDPDFAMVHLQLGQYYATAVGKNEKAVAELQRAYQLRQAVTERERYKIEAAYYSLLERYEDQVQSLNILVSLYPDDEEAHLELAGTEYDMGQTDKAILELRQVLRLNPTSAPAYQSLVFYLAGSNQAQAAIVASREAQRLGIDSARMHWGVGLAYLDMDDVPSARREFQRIGQETETERELQDLYLAVADLYQGKLEAAKDALRKQTRALATVPGGLQTIRHDLLGRIYLLQGRPQDALFEAEEIARTPSAGLQTYDLLNAGTLYARAGRTDKARQILGRLDNTRKAAPSSWNQGCFHNLQGEIWMAAGMFGKAERAFSLAAQEYPQVISHAGLARAYQAQKHWHLAAPEWEQVLRGKGEILQTGFPPDLAYAHLQLARAYRRMNNGDLARSHYQEVLRLWQHGDELPILKDARHELLGLKTQVSTS